MAATKLDDVDQIDLHAFTTHEFASRFFRKLANGYMRCLKLNKVIIEKAMAQATAGGAEDKAMADAMAKRDAEGGSLTLMLD